MLNTAKPTLRKFGDGEHLRFAIRRQAIGFLRTLQRVRNLRASRLFAGNRLHGSPVLAGGSWAEDALHALVNA